MTRPKLRPFPGNDLFPRQLAQTQHNQGFTACQEKRSNNVTWPMRTQINARVGNGCGNNPVKLSPSAIKQAATERDYGVVVDMP